MAVLTGLALAGGLMSAYGSMEEGDEAKRISGAEATQLREGAGQLRAAGQQAGEEELRKSRLVMSRMIAVAAASGAGAVDPTVVKLASGVAGEGELAASMQRYNAETEARGMEKQATTRIRSGEAVQRASRWRAAGSIMQSGYQAFGKGR